MYRDSPHVILQRSVPRLPATTDGFYSQTQHRENQWFLWLCFFFISQKQHFVGKLVHTFWRQPLFLLNSLHSVFLKNRACYTYIPIALSEMCAETSWLGNTKSGACVIRWSTEHLTRKCSKCIGFILYNNNKKNLSVLSCYKFWGEGVSFY